jgi:hypothetical protein
MLRKVLVLLILTATCSGCAMESCNGSLKIAMPEMPIAGSKVAEELAANCNAVKCPNLTRWLNELYLFKVKYNIYRQELAK